MNRRLTEHVLIKLPNITSNNGRRRSVLSVPRDREGEGRGGVGDGVEGEGRGGKGVERGGGGEGKGVERGGGEDDSKWE